MSILWQPILRSSFPVFYDVEGKGFERVFRSAGGRLANYPMLCWVVFIGTAIGTVIIFSFGCPSSMRGV